MGLSRGYAAMLIQKQRAHDFRKVYNLYHLPVTPWIAKQQDHLENSIPTSSFQKPTELENAETVPLSRYSFSHD